MLISIISLICIIKYGKLENDFVKARNRRIISRVCYANIQPINQSLTCVLALYQRRTDNGRETGSARHWNVDAAPRRCVWYVTRTEKGK